MRMAVNLLRKAGYSFAVGAMVAFSAASPADPLALPDSPLFLSTSVQPNLIMAIDDSGSMDNETLFAGNDGAAWWRAANGSGSCPADTGNSFVGCVSNATGTTDVPLTGSLNFNNSGNASGTWKKYTYLFPNGADGSANSARRRAGDSDNDHFAIPALPQYAWARSPVHNVAYFNPGTPYTPWPNGGGYTFANAVPTAARFDPVFGAAITLDLTSDVAGIGNAATTAACSNNDLPGVADNYYFRLYTGMTLPAGTCIRKSDRNWEEVRSTGCAVGTENGCLTREGNTDRTYTMDTESRVAIRYFPATFYLPQTAPPSSDYGYIGATIAGLAPDGTALRGYEIKSGNFASDGQYQAAIQNFANWFTYYRKRHQALRAGLGESFKDVGGLRVAGFTINNRQTVTMRSIDDAANRNALYQNFYVDWVRSGGTPNRNAVAKLIENFQRTDAGAPVISACQKNFGMLFTDGFSNAPADNDGIKGVYGNVDSNQGAPYSDGFTGSMADAVMSAYLNPLRTGDDFPTGRVSVPGACDTNTDVNSLDCNSNLHMNFYAVTLGTRGLLFKPEIADLSAYTDPPPPWPTSFPPRHPSAVDDIWHATVNGRGQLLNARSPKDISTQLKALLSTITKESSTAAPAAVNSGSISSNTLVFQAAFNSQFQTGQLLAYRINPVDGTFSANPVWDASNGLPDPAARNIVTRTSAGAKVPFTWAAISTDPIRSAQLDPDPARAESILNYLRGDATNEGPAANQFRVRADGSGPNKLGDIVSSAPLFVGAPPFRYRDSLETAPYSAFVSSNANRRGVVYAGANDGMLHAFYADSGQELFAFIPSPVFSRLRDLSAQNYTHQFFVDGAPSMGDAFINGSWRTVLAGGLNKGGQGIYAIDVTNPTTLTASSVLWEFTDANDADLGFTYSQPAIVKLRDGRWAAVFGNGYNSTVDDDVVGSPTTTSATGNAVLYVVDLADGKLIRKFDTGVGFAQKPAGVNYDNGLATPSVVDVDGDRIVEFAYAGDLYGNMWKFDLSADSDQNWSIAFNGDPLFTARDAANNRQPITVRPEVARGPSGAGVIVLFGTGKYLEPSDRLLTPVRPQSFYGIVDRGNGPVGITGARNTFLTQQSILVEGTFPGSDFRIRVTSNNTLGGNSGWFMDLLSPPANYQAEKQVSNPIVRNGAVIFTTLIPDSDPCGAGGSSWLMELDLLDGSRLEVTPFDLNRDGEFTSADNITVTLPDGTKVTVPSSGIGSKEGILQSPGVLEGEFGPEGQGKPVQYKYLTGTSGKVQIVIENPGINSTGRQSWRQVR